MRTIAKSNATLAAAAGWIPLRAALAFGAGMRWLSAALPAAARCDRCARRIRPRGWHGLAAHLHTERVNVTRWWGFCSDQCRARWFAAGSAADLHPVVAAGAEPYDPVPMTPDDGQVQLSIIHDDGPGHGAPGVCARGADGEPRLVVANGRLVASVLLASPEAVNRWWRSPAWMTPGLVEVCADFREAA